MAQLYFNEEQYAKVTALQADIKTAETTLAANAGAWDAKLIEEYNKGLLEMKKNFEELIKTCAKMTIDAPVVDSKSTDDVFSVLLEKYSNYLKECEQIREKYGEKDGLNEPLLDKAFEVSQNKLTRELEGVAVPNVRALFGMIDAQLAEKEQAVKDSGSDTPGSQDELESLQKMRKTLAEVKAEFVKDLRAKGLDSLGASCAKASEGIGTLKTNFTSLTDTVGASDKDFTATMGKVLEFAQGAIGGIGAVVSGVSAAMSVSSMKAIASVKMMESASAILMIISGVIQVATAIASLFNNDKQFEKIQEASKAIRSQLEFELKNSGAIAIESQVHAIDRLRAAYEGYHMVIIKDGKLQSNPTSRADQLRNDQALIDSMIASYTELGYSVGKALGEERFKSSSAQLQNLARQQQELYIQMDAEQNKKKSDEGLIQQYQQDIQKLGAEMMQVLSEMTEEIIGGSAIQIAKKLGDAFFEAFEKGGNAAKAWAEKVDVLVADIVKRMLIQQVLEPKIADIFNRYQKEWFPGGDFKGIDNIINSMPDFKSELNGVGAIFANTLKVFMDSANGVLLSQDGDSGGTSGKGFQTMSQDTGEELNGRFTAIQIHTANISALLTERFPLLCEAQLRVRDLASELRELTVQGYLQLVQIADNTQAVIKPIQNISRQLDTISIRIKEL